MLKNSIQVKPYGSASQGYKVWTAPGSTEGKKPRKLYDAWIPELAPDPTLTEIYENGKMQWRDFSRQYRRLLKSTLCQEILKPLALLSLRRKVVLLCNCANHDRCPTQILAEIILECRKKGNFELNHLNWKERRNIP